MDHAAALLTQHDLVAVFVVVLAATIGVPIPALPVLLFAGVQAAEDAAYGFEALGLATLASMLSAGTWFAAGRRFGRRVLALLCRVSISPDTCVRKNEVSFAKRGALTLVIAKFVPGLSLVAPPLAGALGMRASQFFLFSTVGAALWAGAGIAAGLIFHAQISQVVAALGRLGGPAILIVAGLLVLYVAWRSWTRWRVARALAGADKIAASELATLIREGPKPIIIDVRSRGLASASSLRLPGALNIDLASLPLISLDEWPETAAVVTYCDCPNDASAVKAAQILGQRGRRSRVLIGGLDGWSQAGHPTERD
ncbi:MAG: VTT domain-containing protein [Burkholderiales bacterium]